MPHRNATAAIPEIVTLAQNGNKVEFKSATDAQLTRTFAGKTFADQQTAIERIEETARARHMAELVFRMTGTQPL